MIRLWKAHGLGNDYLVLESGPTVTPSLARAWCDRHRGAGADGILEPLGVRGGAYGVRIWNPDGSVAETSGNGLRIFGVWLADRGAGAAFDLDPGGGSRRFERTADGGRVAMGRAVVRPRRLDDPLGDVSEVDLGNPHLVVWAWDDATDWRTLGARYERDPRFPNRTNVQFARVTGDSSVHLHIWERGAGATAASGSSATAVAAAAVATSRLAPGQITAEMAGGRLIIDVDRELNSVLEGPVQAVGTFTLAP